MKRLQELNKEVEALNKQFAEQNAGRPIWKLQQDNHRLLQLGLRHRNSIQPALSSMDAQMVCGCRYAGAVLVRFQLHCGVTHVFCAWMFDMRRPR